MKTSTMKKYFLYFILLCIFCAVAITTCEASTLDYQVNRTSVSSTREGRQLITFEATFRNISREYISKINYADIEVYGYVNGREERYKRKVDVNWNFSPTLGPGERKSLNIKFDRTVQPQQGFFQYDDVKIKILNINFRRAR